MNRLVILLVLIPNILAAARVSLQVGRSRVGIGERFIIRATATSTGGERGYFKLTTGNNFRVISGSSSQNFSFSYSTGGASVAKRQYSRDFVLTAKRAGFYRIGPCVYTQNGKKFRSNSVRVTVVRGRTGSRSTFRRRRFSFGFGNMDPDEDDEPLEVKVGTSFSVQKPYVSQETVLYLDVYSSRNAVFRIRPVIPSIPGFWVERIKKSHSEEPVKVRKDGKIWYRYRYHIARLYPARAGQLAISPVKGIIRTSGFFSRGSRFTTRKKILTARSIPGQGRPGGFTGVVGKFSLSMEPVQETLYAGEPFHLTIRVSGRGLLQTITSLEKVFPEGTYRILAPKIDSSSNRDNRGDVKERIFTYTIYPGKSGTLPLPVFKLSYFDPFGAVFKIITTKKGYLTVEKARDADTGQPARSNLSRSKPLVHTRGPEYAGKTVKLISIRIFALGILSLILFTLGNIFFTRRRDALLADPEKLKKLNAWTRARALQNSAVHALKEKDMDRALGELEKALRGFVADKAGRSGGNQPYAVLEQAMRTAMINDGLIREYLDICQHCGQLRYGAVPDTSTVVSVLNRGKAVLVRLRKEWS